jgi:hypothetical protein
MTSTKRTRLEATVARELPKLRERIVDLKRQAEAEEVHPDLAQVYKKDAQDLEALAECAADGHYAAAVMIADRLDTAVRDELGQHLYDAIHALAGEPQAIDEEDLFDALKDNLSPQAVAAIVAYLQPAQTKNEAVNRQLRWFSDRLTELVGGPGALGGLMDELGL